MAKLTIEIDMDDPQETWDALYRRIEEFGNEPEEDDEPSGKTTLLPTTYDLLLDPDQNFSDAADFFSVFTGQD